MLDDLETESEWPQRITTAAGTLAAVAIALAGAFWLAAPNAPSVAENFAAVASDRLSIVAVETEWCSWCKRFKRDVLPEYERSDYAHRVPIRSIDLAQQTSSGYRFASTIRSVPTFVLVDREGREIDRIRGYPGGPARFFEAVDRMLTTAASAR